MKTLFDDHRTGAQFSACFKYRYTLWRHWDDTKPAVAFIGLNPSTANECDNDPTIKSVIRIAKHNGYGVVIMLNCFPFISTDPKQMAHCEPLYMGINDHHINENTALCKDVVFAWGAFKVVVESGRGKELQHQFPNALCIGKTKSGAPLHRCFCHTR